MAVTIKDVAREAQVSVATVSRALNGHQSVTPDMRRHIHEVAARLRYMPHGAARSLSSRRTQTVGALLPDLYGEFFSELIRGIDQVARRHGLHLLISSSHGDSKELAAALRAMRGRVDGLLVMSPYADAGFLAENLPQALPTVLMNTHIANGDHASLAVDNYGGAHTVVRHLLGLGHRRIALISGPDGNFDAAERARGYRDALTEGEGEPPEIYLGDFTEKSGHRAAQQILAQGALPDAIFAANDSMALGCLFALHEAGLEVPNDVALVGFDDIPLARLVNPPLTTVRVRIAELGGRAMTMLAKSIAGTEGTAKSEQTLPTELVVRASCGGGGGRSSE